MEYRLRERAHFIPNSQNNPFGSTFVRSRYEHANFHMLSATIMMSKYFYRSPDDNDLKMKNNIYTSKPFL